MPREGDVLEGTVSSITTGTSEYGNYPIITIRQSDGNERAFHAFHTAARSQLVRLRPSPGDTLGIKYLGRKRAKNAPRGYSAYENYAIRSDRAAYDWDADRTADQPDPDDGDIPY